MLPYQIDLPNVLKIVLAHPGHSNETRFALVHFDPPLHGPLNIVVCICPPGQFPEHDQDIFMLDTDPESEEDAEMPFGPAPGPSHLKRAIPQREVIVISSDSESDSEADSKDVVGKGKVKQQDSDAGKAAASGDKNHVIKKEHTK